MFWLYVFVDVEMLVNQTGQLQALREYEPLHGGNGADLKTVPDNMHRLVLYKCIKQC